VPSGEAEALPVQHLCLWLLISLLLLQ